MTKEYVEQRNGGYYVAGSRVSLDSIVHAYWRGQSPESILQSFPVLNLEQIYGAITFYLAQREEIDAYLEKARLKYEELRQASRAAHPELYKKLAEAKRQRQLSHQ